MDEDGVTKAPRFGENIAEHIEEIPLRRMDRRTIIEYVVLLALTVCVLVLGIVDHRAADIIVAIPIIILIVMTLIFDKEFIHVPPTLILLVVITMIIMQCATYFREESPILNITGSILTGIVLCLIGLVVAYMALGKVPGFANEKPALIAIESFTFGLALFSIWMMVVYFLPSDTVIVDPGKYKDMGYYMEMQIFVMIGCFITSFVFFEGNHNDYIRRMITKFMDRNSSLVGLDVSPADEVQAIIASGESDTVEFKSTLHTNLRTNANDKNMERAFLKSIVAFLNTAGGTLLVGVEDNGNILGVEIEDYDNPDKMNLNITSLISSQIGAEFIPFIRFRQVVFGKKLDSEGNVTDIDKIVVRFDCQPTLSPVFLIEGKKETFFVRSGPSSVEVTGLELINYVNNRKKTYKRKYSLAKPVKKKQTPE